MARRKADSSQSLFPPRTPLSQPLADRMRPRTLDEIVGQEHLLGPGKFLSQMVAAHVLHSMILWGPPGTGKTTLALVLAEQSGAVFRKLAAVTSGVADLREAVEAARHDLEAGKRTVVFIDEIHRWNRAQQDAFLPHVESGLITLIGATTENPSFEVISALLSRMRLLVLHPLSEENVATLVHRALADKERGLGETGLKLGVGAIDEIVRYAGGDARRALGTLEIAAEFAQNAGATLITPEHIRESAQQKALLYDRAGEEHYNVISAFIKSMRGSDPDAAIYWMMRMVEAGEDPLFIARRMVIFASEDVGNADPARIASGDRGQGSGGLRRDARRRDPARAGRDLPGQCAEVQRLVSRDARGGRRCENAWRAAGAAAFAQRADADDEGTRLRQGLPLSARFRRRAGRAELPARRTGRENLLRAVRARLRNQDPRVSCPRA